MALEFINVIINYKFSLKSYMFAKYYKEAFMEKCL